MPIDTTPGPFPVDLRRLLVANGLTIYATAVGDDVRQVAPHFPANAVGPGLVLQFCVAGLPHAVTILMPRHAIDGELGEAVTDLTGKVLRDDPALYAAQAQAHELNLRSGAIPGGPDVHCPGCNSRLYGDVAIRGGCLACYPDLGPLEQAAELGEETHR